MNIFYSIPNFVSDINIYILIFNKKKLEFDLKGTPIATNDVIDVELKDYENIGANKLEP